MNPTRSVFILICGGAMALIWRLAVTNYISLAAFARPFPLPEAVLTLGLSAVISALTRRHGWRVVTVIGWHGVGLALMLLRTVYTYHTWSHPFWSYRWMGEWIASTPGPSQWLAMVLIAVMGVWFWCAGWFLIRGRASIRSYYARLDLGLAFFFGIYLTKFLVWQKAGLEIADPLSQPLLIAFMLFGLLAIGLARHQGSVPTQFIAGHKTIGMMISAVVVAMLFSTGLLVLFLPYLTAMAEVGYGVLKTVSTPVGSVLMAVLRFMFAPRQMRSEPPAASAASDLGGGGTVSESSWWVDLIQTIVTYFAVGMGGLIVLAGLGVLAWLLLRWLWSRTTAGEPAADKFIGWAWWNFLRRVLQHLAVGCRWVGLSLRRSPASAARYFKALLAWGLHSGLPRKPGETPLEYAKRLNTRFPMLGSDILTIVDLFDQELYGTLVLDPGQLLAAQLALRHLRSPVQWGRRLRCWLSWH